MLVSALAAPEPATDQLTTARVLVPAAGSGRSALAAALTTQGLATLVVPASALVQQVSRGGLDLVLLHGETGNVMAELAALRRVSTVSVVVVLRPDRSGQMGMASLERALLAGADDCVARGVSRIELAARVQAVLRRRSRSVASEVLSAGPFALDVARHVFSARGTTVHLPPKEFGLLELLLRRDGRVVSRQEALDRVWGPSRGPGGRAAEGGSEPSTVDVHVKRLRGRLEDDPATPRHLLTVRGLGYRFVG